jgi:hypothetical protein
VCGQPESSKTVEEQVTCVIDDSRKGAYFLSQQHSIRLQSGLRNKVQFGLHENLATCRLTFIVEMHDAEACDSTSPFRHSYIGKIKLESPNEIKIAKFLWYIHERGVRTA